MRHLSACLLLLAASLLSPAHACPDDLQEAAAFVTGQWTVVDDQGEVLGYSEFRPAAGGCGFRENWEGVDGVRGEATVTAAEGEGDWKMSWSDSDGLSLELSGRQRGQSLVFTGTQTTDDGDIHHRIAYDFLFQIGELRQTWEYQHEGETRWRTFFNGWYIPSHAWGQ